MSHLLERRTKGNFPFNHAARMNSGMAYLFAVSSFVAKSAMKKVRQVTGETSLQLAFTAFA